jgi:hypothetical protein
LEYVHPLVLQDIIMILLIVYHVIHHVIRAQTHQINHAQVVTIMANIQISILFIINVILRVRKAILIIIRFVKVLYIYNLKIIFRMFGFVLRLYHL